MFSFFKSKDYKQARSIIAKTTLQSDSFINFEKDLISFVDILNNHPNIFAQLLAIIKECPLTPLKAVKIIMVFYRYIQSSKTRQHFQEVFLFLQYMDGSVQDLLQRGKKRKEKMNGATKQKANLDSSKEMIRQPEYQCQNFEEIILAQIALPLILILEKKIFSYQDIFGKSADRVLDDICWAQLNFLRKISHLAVQFEGLGRYFLGQSCEMVLKLVKILSYDVQKKLYKVISSFASRKIAILQSLIQENRLRTKQQIKSENLQQFLIFIAELQSLNESLRLLYCGKYFAYKLIQNQIYCPTFFRANVYMIEQLYLFTQKGQNASLSKASMLISRSKDRAQREQQLFQSI